MKRIIIGLATAAAVVAAPVAALAGEKSAGPGDQPIAGDKRDPSRSQRATEGGSGAAAGHSQGVKAGDRPIAGDKRDPSRSQRVEGSGGGSSGVDPSKRFGPPAGDKRDPARSERVDPKPDTTGSTQKKEY